MNVRSHTIKSQGRTIPYVVQLPPEFESSPVWPILLFLHGAGERGSDGSAQTRVGIGPALEKYPRKFPFIIVMPQCPRGSYWDSLEEPVLGALEQAARDYGGDRRRICLTGVSMGGYGTWSIGSLHPELFAALVPICGGGDPEAMAPGLRDTPIWAFHGARDEVVPPEESRIMVQAVEAAGNRRLRYTEYPQGTHNVWDAAYAEAELVPWILSWSR